MQNEEKKKKITDLIKPRIITFSSMPYIILAFLSALLVGITEIVKPDFEWSYFLTAEYWYNVFLLNVANILIAISALLRRSETIVLEDKDGIIATNTKALNDIAPEIQDKLADEFIEQTNREIKKTLFIIRTKKKLFNLEKNVSINSHTKYIEYQSIIKDNSYKDIYKDIKKYEKNGYIKRKNKYLKQLEEEWIEKNIDIIRVKKCPKLSRGFLTSGVKSDFDGDFPISRSVVIIKGLMPKFLLTFAISIAFYSFGLDIEKLGWISIITLSYKMISLVLNWIYGARFADQYVKETIIEVLYMRIRWLVRYREWKKNYLVSTQNQENTLKTTENSKNEE